MNNNSENYKNHPDSLGAMIQKISYPFETFQEKIDAVNEKLKPFKVIEQKHIDAYKAFFLRYFECEKQANFYGLKLELPKLTKQ